MEGPSKEKLHFRPQAKGSGIAIINTTRGHASILSSWQAANKQIKIDHTTLTGDGSKINDKTMLCNNDCSVYQVIKSD